MASRTNGWCIGGVELVRLLGDTFGKEHVFVRSPHHIQVKNQTAVHDVWVNSSGTVKYKLSGQAGRAQVAGSSKQLFAAIGGHDERGTDLVNMRQALELSQLIDSAKAALPHCGVSRAVFVDAGSKNGRTQIGVVQVVVDSEGEHVRAESHPSTATDSDAAEEAAIHFAVSWARANDVIFCDSKSVVERVRRQYGDRVRWLPREKNKAADRVANLRSKRKRRRGRRKRKAKAK
jgi:ribonuclease HI